MLVAGFHAVFAPLKLIAHGCLRINLCQSDPNDDLVSAYLRQEYWLYFLAVQSHQPVGFPTKQLTNAFRAGTA
jgi:hypothetical protein